MEPKELRLNPNDMECFVMNAAVQNGTLLLQDLQGDSDQQKYQAHTFQTCTEP